MRELLETVLAITLSLLGAMALVGGTALAVCTLSIGCGWFAIRRIRAAVRARRSGRDG